MEQIFCPKCKTAIVGSANFCPSCGYKMHEPTISLSLTKLIGVFLLSILLPPFGLIPAIRYIRFGDASTKKVGIVVIVLTIIATGVTIWLFMGFMTKVNQIINYQLSTPDLNY